MPWVESHSRAFAARHDSRDSDNTRHSIRAMRSLAVDISPQHLHDQGLESALEDLLARVGARGVQTTTQIDGPLLATAAVNTSPSPRPARRSATLSTAFAPPP